MSSDKDWYFSEDYLCPECGEDLVGTDEEHIGSCIVCGWNGTFDDAAIDTSSPLDIRIDDRTPIGEEPGQRQKIKIPLDKLGGSITLTPNQAENLAETLTHAAADARGNQDPGRNFGDDSGRDFDIDL